MRRGAKANLGGDFNGLAAATQNQETSDKPKRVVNGLNGEDPSAVDLATLLNALQAVRVGDFSVRLPRDQAGLAGKVADTFNEIVMANERMAQQLAQVGQSVGREGQTRRPL